MAVIAFAALAAAPAAAQDLTYADHGEVPNREPVPKIALADGPFGGVPTGRVAVAAYHGISVSGCHGMRVERVRRIGSLLLVEATFSIPGTGPCLAVVSFPSRLMSLAAADVSGVTDALLVDQHGKERARTRRETSAQASPVPVRRDVCGVASAASGMRLPGEGFVIIDGVVYDLGDRGRVAGVGVIYPRLDQLVAGASVCIRGLLVPSGAGFYLVTGEVALQPAAPSAARLPSTTTRR